MGSGTDRKLSQVCVVELQSRHIRESVVKKAEKLSLKDKGGNSLQIARAKTNMQLQRNKFMKKAFEKIKHHDLSQNKSVKLNWQIEGSKDRTITVADIPVFRQSISDMQGSFLDAYSSVTF